MPRGPDGRTTTPCTPSPIPTPALVSRGRSPGSPAPPLPPLRAAPAGKSRGRGRGAAPAMLSSLSRAAARRHWALWARGSGSLAGVPTHVVDLRSDTVTQPGLAMRRAMAEAVVGDDDYGEDPTVRGEPGVQAGVLAATPARCPRCWQERWPGTQGWRPGCWLGIALGTFATQSDLSLESLLEIQILGSHSGPAEPESAT